MTIDYKLIIAQLTVLLQGIFIKDLPLVEATGLAYISASESRLETLAANALSGDLTKDDILNALAAEKDIFISELKSFQVEGESLAQQAINNAEQIFTGIVGNVLPA